MTLDLKKLFHDVFAPAKSDNVLFIVDLPHVTPDSPKWTRRREMAGRWHAAMESLAKEKGFSVMPIAYYLDVGQHNNSLPDAFQLEADWVKAEALVGSASLIIAMSTWSATAPLHEWVDRYPELRAASLPGITPEMEETALAANYAQIAAYCRVLKPKLVNLPSRAFRPGTNSAWTCDGARRKWTMAAFTLRTSARSSICQAAKSFPLSTKEKERTLIV
jgi:hypothetical protein